MRNGAKFNEFPVCNLYPDELKFIHCNYHERGPQTYLYLFIFREGIRERKNRRMNVKLGEGELIPRGYGLSAKHQSVASHAWPLSFPLLLLVSSSSYFIICKYSHVRSCLVLPESPMHDFTCCLFEPFLCISVTYQLKQIWSHIGFIFVLVWWHLINRLWSIRMYRTQTRNPLIRGHGTVWEIKVCTRLITQKWKKKKGKNCACGWAVLAQWEDGKPKARLTGGSPSGSWRALHAYRFTYPFFGYEDGIG